jgi:hypothetical protein
MGGVVPGQNNVNQNHTLKNIWQNFTRHGGLGIFKYFLKMMERL